MNSKKVNKMAGLAANVESLRRAASATIKNMAGIKNATLDNATVNDLPIKNRYLKKLILTAIIAVPVTPVAYAQLLNAPGLVNQIDATSRVDNITRQVDDTAEQIKRRTERNLEQLKPGIDALTNTTNTLIDPILKLPQQLPILGADGKTAFVDVEVEHGWRAVEKEWLVMLDESELASLQTLPINILEKTRFDDLELTLVRFRVPAELDSLAELKKRLPAKFSGRIDRNHIYASQAASVPLAANAMEQTPSTICADSIKIGMIDSAIKQDHIAFKFATDSKKLIGKKFIEEALVAPDAHGTAVAGLLIGNAQEIKPLLANASLYAASVFYERNEYAQGATMINLVRALNWLSSENVSVINMSLAGPDNQILAKVIATTISKGIAIVAAAGNAGPAAPPMFPAAYPGVIAATAVDGEKNIYRWANRGSYIYFAAPGVSVTTARSSGGFGRESGTSMAAPVVSAFVACEMVKAKNLDEVVAHLAGRAVDLGEKGRDNIFGYGLLK